MLPCKEICELDCKCIVDGIITEVRIVCIVPCSSVRLHPGRPALFRSSFQSYCFRPCHKSLAAHDARPAKYLVHVTHLMHACHRTIASYSTRSGAHAIVPVKIVVESLKKAGGSVVLFSQRSVPLCPAISFKDRRLFLL